MRWLIGRTAHTCSCRHQNLKVCAAGIVCPWTDEPTRCVCLYRYEAHAERCVVKLAKFIQANGGSLPDELSAGGGGGALAAAVGGRGGFEVEQPRDFGGGGGGGGGGRLRDSGGAVDGDEGRGGVQPWPLALEGSPGGGDSAAERLAGGGGDGGGRSTSRRTESPRRGRAQSPQQQRGGGRYGYDRDDADDSVSDSSSVFGAGLDSGLGSAAASPAATRWSAAADSYGGYQHSPAASMARPTVGDRYDERGNSLRSGSKHGVQGRWSSRGGGGGAGAAAAAASPSASPRASPPRRPGGGGGRR
jgi:hypothetical protein